MSMTWPEVIDALAGIGLEVTDTPEDAVFALIDAAAILSVETSMNVDSLKKRVDESCTMFEATHEAAERAMRLRR